jgi:hypothetical protein
MAGLESTMHATTQLPTALRAEFVPSFYRTQNPLRSAQAGKAFIVSGLMCFSTPQKGLGS